MGRIVPFLSFSSDSLDMSRPLYWKVRKRLAVEYQHAIWRFFPSYVKAQARKRVGNCDGCGFKWLCCMGCSHFDEQAEKCGIYDTRPNGCRMFPMDRFQTWVMCGDGCKLRWDERF